MIPIFVLRKHDFLILDPYNSVINNYVVFLTTYIWHPVMRQFSLQLILPVSEVKHLTKMDETIYRADSEAQSVHTVEAQSFIGIGAYGYGAWGTLQLMRLTYQVSLTTKRITRERNYLYFGYHITALTDYGWKWIWNLNKTHLKTRYWQMNDQFFFYFKCKSSCIRKFLKYKQDSWACGTGC